VGANGLYLNLHVLDAGVHTGDLSNSLSSQSIHIAGLHSDEDRLILAVGALLLTIIALIQTNVGAVDDVVLSLNIIGIKSGTEGTSCGLQGVHAGAVDGVRVPAVLVGLTVIAVNTNIPLTELAIGSVLNVLIG